MVEAIRDVFSNALTTTFLAAIVAIFVRALPLVSAQDTEQKTKESEWFICKIFFKIV